MLVSGRVVRLGFLMAEVFPMSIKFERLCILLHLVNLWLLLANEEHKVQSTQ